MALGRSWLCGVGSQCWVTVVGCGVLSQFVALVLGFRLGLLGVWPQLGFGVGSELDVLVLGHNLGGVILGHNFWILYWVTVWGCDVGSQFGGVMLGHNFGGVMLGHNLGV